MESMENPVPQPKKGLNKRGLIGGAAAVLAVAALITGLVLGQNSKKDCKGIIEEYFRAVEQADSAKILSLSVFGLPDVQDEAGRQKRIEEIDGVLRDIGENIQVRYTVLKTSKRTLTQKISPLRSRRLIVVGVDYRTGGTNVSFMGVGDFEFLKEKGRWYIVGDPPSFFFKKIK